MVFFFFFFFAVVHNLLDLPRCLQHHDHLYQLTTGPGPHFHRHHCPRDDTIITKIIKTKNHETMKPTGRLNNQTTKKPYSPQVSSKTTTFHLYESSWQKQLKEAISNWTSGCDAPQKIGKTAVMKLNKTVNEKQQMDIILTLHWLFFS